MATPCAVTDMKYCPGVPVCAPRGLRTHICQVPRTEAARKAANATQKCARQRILIFRDTVDPPIGVRLEFISREHLNDCPHFAVPQTAKLVTRHQKIACADELRVDLCHIAGD